MKKFKVLYIYTHIYIDRERKGKTEMGRGVGIHICLKLIKSKHNRHYMFFTKQTTEEGGKCSVCARA